MERSKKRRILTSRRKWSGDQIKEVYLQVGGNGAEIKDRKFTSN